MAYYVAHLRNIAGCCVFLLGVYLCGYTFRGSAEANEEIEGSFGEVEDDKEPEAMITSVNEVDSQSKEHGQQLDERHQIFQPYVAVDEDDRPTAPVLDILDSLFKEIKAKKDVGIALYCVRDLKWLASYPTYNDMVAVFGTDIVGSKSNYSTYMALVRQTTDDYSNATSEFLTDVRAMKPKLRRIEEGMR